MSFRIFTFIFISIGFSSAIFAQDKFDEAKVMSELERFRSNPKEYYNKIQALKKQIKEANENSATIAEEYMSQLNEKDEEIKRLKSGKKTTTTTKKSNAIKKPISNIEGADSEDDPYTIKGESASSSDDGIKPISTLYKQNATNNTTAKNTNTIKPIESKDAYSSDKKTIKKTEILENAKYPYRVQIASFKSDRLRLLLENPKSFTVTRLANRNVFEVMGFETADEAYLFAQELKASDYSHAFVTKYVNGQRVEDYNILLDKPELRKGKGKQKATPKKVESATEIQEEPVSYPERMPNGYRELKGEIRSEATPTKVVKKSNVYTDITEPTAPKRTPNAMGTTKPTKKATFQPDFDSNSEAPLVKPPSNTQSKKASLDDVFNTFFDK